MNHTREFCAWCLTFLAMMVALFLYLENKDLHSLYRKKSEEMQRLNEKLRDAEMRHRETVRDVMGIR